jgi:hypothetical protein
LNTAILAKIQFWLLIGISGLLLWLSPSVWNYSPDAGVYVGTAKSMVETGRYWFNGHPNLLYYPGLSSLLSIPIYLFGLNFQIMHLMCTAIGVLCLWLARSYFSVDRYGVVGLAVPLALVCAKIFHRQAFSILSDGLFLALVLSALLLWRKFEETSLGKYLVTCCIVAAAAPMVRFEGLFVCAALGAALLYRIWQRRDLTLLSFLKLGGICLAILTPFILWTLRNWAAHTPDTFNMANGLFFGLQGMQLYITEAAAGTAEPAWHYGGVRFMRLVMALANIFLTTNIVQALPLYVWIVFVLYLCAGGASRWFRAATIFERIFTLLMLTFLLVWTLRSGGQTYYDVPRYWLSVLPLVMVMMGFCFVGLYEAAGTGLRRHVVSTLAVALLALVMVSGTAKITRYVVKDNYFAKADSVLRKTAGYFDETIPRQARIATTNWGVVPLLLDRQSYIVLNDPTHRHSLRRMLTYKTQYLVILDEINVFTPAARHLVSQYPMVFAPVFEAKPEGPGPFVSVYTVDLAAIESWLARTEGPAS